MKKSTQTRVFFLIVASLSLAGLLGWAAPKIISHFDSDHAILPNGIRIELELAVTDQQRERGLGFRRELPEKSGMLFIYEKFENLRFWMKDCFIPLDIIWMDNEGKIIRIAENLPPSKPGTPLSAIAQAESYGQYVLELNAGSSRKWNLNVGDRIDLKFKIPGL